ncbi:hypothetical protein J6590_107312, partial [Homalodisca vitripennis]
KDRLTQVSVDAGRGRIGCQLPPEIRREATQTRIIEVSSGDPTSNPGYRNKSSLVSSFSQHCFSSFLSSLNVPCIQDRHLLQRIAYI